MEHARRQATHASAGAGDARARPHAAAPRLQAAAGNRAVAGLLAPRSVQRRPHVHGEDDYATRGPKGMDPGFSAGHATTDAGDAGFTLPQAHGDGLDLGYGHSGDAGFDWRPDDGGRQSGGLGQGQGGMAGGVQPDVLGGLLDIAGQAGSTAWKGLSGFAGALPFTGAGGGAPPMIPTGLPLPGDGPDVYESLAGS